MDGFLSPLFSRQDYELSAPPPFDTGTKFNSLEVRVSKEQDAGAESNDSHTNTSFFTPYTEKLRPGSKHSQIGVRIETSDRYRFHFVELNSRNSADSQGLTIPLRVFFPAPTVYRRFAIRI